MADPRHTYGSRSEDQAAAYLQARGYLIRARNARYKVGEIDIVAEDGETLVFIEVRARTDPDQVHPAATVTPRKQRQIVRAAMAYCQDHRIRDQMIRFDVVAVLGLDGEIELIQDAFDAGR